MDAFVAARKPILGICRGQQFINVYFGGSLIQDLPAKALHARGMEEETDKFHEAVIADGSYLEPIYGERFVINSAHHQAVNRVGNGLMVDLYSAEEGIVEAMHHRELPIWSVQWHPERCNPAHGAPKEAVDGDRIFAFFKAKLI